MNHRPERVASLIREELAFMIQREMEFSGLVTITEVEVDKNLEGATVEVSVIPASATREAIDALTARAGHFQHLLLKKINIKPMPRIRFAIDHGPENAAKVEKLLEDDKM